MGLLGWWYGAGWKGRVQAVRERVAATMDYFSISLLLRTLFSPFRQISAGSVQGSLTVQMRALFDNLLSRVIGMIARSMMIIVGIIAIILTLIIGGVLVCSWAIVPLLPLVGLVFMLMGWIPWIR